MIADVNFRASKEDRSMRYSTLIGLSAITLVVLAVACGPTAPPLPTPAPPVQRQRTPTPEPTSDEGAIRQIINAECEAVVQQDIDRLQGLWDTDGLVTDANHTSDTPNDDVKWKGWEAIRDRYVNIVFPSQPAFCEHPDVQVTLTGDTAQATSTTKIGITLAPKGDLWTFKKVGGAWKITGLTYNLAPQK
jgi:ketosteroid isomerase-like protein